MNQRMPALFIGHGSPMNTIEDNAFRRSWQELGNTLPKAKAIVCVSAHWETMGIAVTASPAPETIHDFYGFPQALFDVQYPSSGNPELAKQIADLLGEEIVHLDAERGLDHGAWSVLQPMYPSADIPVLQLSLDRTRDAASHYELAKKLRLLREQGVLILGSGNIVHNLRVFNFQQTQTYDWATVFDQMVKNCILQKDHVALCNYSSFGEMAALSIPTAEHYLPLLYVLAQQQDDENLTFFNEDVMSSISMRSLQIG
ncbi:MAG: 4,5-DOPA dioxygenase extradiol [Arenimonas sp.]